MVNFEKLALASILEGKTDINQCKFTDFSSYTAKFVAKIIKKYWDKYNKAPTKEVLISAISNQISEEKARIYNGYIKGLPTDVKEDTKVILDGLRESSAIKTLDSKIENLVELAQNREIGGAKAVLNELLVALTDTETNAEDAKDIEFDTERIQKTDFCLKDVDLKAQGLTLISAKAGFGKSLLALQQALYSYKEGKDILFINLELSKVEMLSRALSCAYDIPISDVYKNLTEEEVKKYSKLKDKLFSLPNKFKMINQNITSEEIINTIRAEAKTGLDVVVIDYLQLVDKPQGYGEQWQFLTVFAKELHQLSLELGITIISPIQVNEVTFKNDSIQVTTRGSRELEFSSSLWVHIHQDDKETTDNICRLFTIKARHAKRLTYVLETDFEHMKFKSTGMYLENN